MKNSRLVEDVDAVIGLFSEHEHLGATASQEDGRVIRQQGGDNCMTGSRGDGRIVDFLGDNMIVNYLEEIGSVRDERLDLRDRY